MRRIVIGLIVLAGLTAAPAPSRAKDDEAIAKAEARLENRQADRKQLELEMITAWEGLARDFGRLKGDGGDRLRTTLSELADRMVRDTPRDGDAFADRLARALRGRVNSGEHLSPAVSDLYAQRVAEIVAADSKVTGGDASNLALDELIPLSLDVDRIWDLRFADHPTVVAWRHVNVDIEQATLDLQLANEGLAHGDENPPGMVFVPTGKFKVGPNDTLGTWVIGASEEVENETVGGFYIDVSEVTNEAYAAFLSKLPAKERPDYLPDGWKLEPPHFGPGRGQHPVTGVTFAQAWRFAKENGKRLPTELEWEKAARGPNGSLWPWGDTFDGTKLVWAGKKPARKLTRAKKGEDFSGYGVCDMAGNVSEMVATKGDEKRTTLKKPPAEFEQFIVRGGSFAVKEKDELKTRLTHRWVMMAGAHRPDVGFRCVMDERAWKRPRK